ncbi:MAG TPA: hypothetical protein VGC42_03450, partial [Kofleriaceae bacterium]
GVLEADLDRLSRIAAVLDRIAEPYRVTLDGNEQFSEAAQVEALWSALASRPQLARLAASVLFIEQPDRSYDASIREFRITDRGVVVADTFDSAEQILTGTARIVIEPES